jgi:murein DD-endopeptidase MepM/ murein hydrolase activator NlpD
MFRVFLRTWGVWTAAVFCLLSVASAAASSKPARWTVHIQPARLVNGAPVLFEIAPPSPLKSLSGTWFDHQVLFWLSGDSWYGLAGVSLDAKPGVYTLELNGVTGKGTAVKFQGKISVGKAKYPHVKVSVPTKFTQPNPEEQKKIATDSALKHEVFAHVEKDRLWSGNFLPPVTARVSDVFGTTRTFNGQVEGVHQGLDFAVPQGTAVQAINRGTVLLAQPLYFEGGCVILDHGQGLLSIYMHLSKIEVKAGEAIARGARIGLSGGTGRATGPHLHVAARWQGVYVDPAKLLAMRMP